MDAEQKLKQFAVRLFQTAEVHTETFEIEALTEAEALAKAGEILATKDLEGVEHRLEAHDVTPEPAEEPETPDQAPATDTASNNLPYEAPADPTAPAGPVAAEPTAPTQPEQSGQIVSTSAPDQPGVQADGGGVPTAPVAPVDGQNQPVQGPTNAA